MNINIVWQIAAVMVVAIISYIILIRPQLGRLNGQRLFQENLKEGDVVFTTGGLIGKITKLEGKTVVEIKFSELTRMKILRSNVEGYFKDCAPSENVIINAKSKFEGSGYSPAYNRTENDGNYMPN